MSILVYFYRAAFLSFFLVPQMQAYAVDEDLFKADGPFSSVQKSDQSRFKLALERQMRKLSIDFSSNADVDAKVVTVPGALDKVVERAVAADEDEFLKIVARKSGKTKEAQDYLDMVDQVIAGTTGFDAVTTPEEFSKAIDGLEAQVIKLKGELKKATDAAVAAPKPAAGKPHGAAPPAGNISGGRIPMLSLAALHQLLKAQ